MIDFQVFRGMDVSGLKSQPAAPIETFARFQAGFLSSEDFHRFPSMLGLLRLARLAGFAGLAGLARLAGRRFPIDCH